MKAKEAVPWVRYWGDGALPSGPFQVDDACIAALEALHPNGERAAAPEHFGGNPLACDPDAHPDAATIKAWLANSARAADDLRVIFWLAYFVRNEWARLPKRTRAEHSRLYSRIAKLCRELRGAMQETGARDLGDWGWGLQHTPTLSLLNDDEAARLIDACTRVATGDGGKKSIGSAERRLLGILLSWPTSIPDVPMLLERLEAKAKLLDVEGPLHTQPKKRGAERGYFVRRTAELFQKQYGEQPHEVIAALTTIALGEATDRELVAKLLAPRTL